MVAVNVLFLTRAMVFHKLFTAPPVRHGSLVRSKNSALLIIAKESGPAIPGQDRGDWQRSMTQRIDWKEAESKEGDRLAVSIKPHNLRSQEFVRSARDPWLLQTAHLG